MSENGGIGRHARLRTLWPLRLWGFDSPFSHSLFLCILLFLFQGCTPSPEHVAQSALMNYAQGDRNGFLDSLSKDSRQWMEGLFTLENAETHAFQVDSYDCSMRVESVQILEGGLQSRDSFGKVQLHDIALVEVLMDGTRIPLTLIEEPSGWKLDLFSLGDVWKSASFRALPRL